MRVIAQPYTAIPNALLETMHDLSLCEIKVFLALARETFGYHRAVSRVLSYTIIAEKVGLSEAGARKGADGLVAKGRVERERAGAGNRYAIKIDTPVSISDSEASREVAEIDTPVREIDTPVSPPKERGKEIQPPSCSNAANVGQRATERTGEGRIDKTKHLEQLLAANPTTYDLLLEVSSLQAQDPTPGELDRRARHLLALAQDRTWAAVRHGLQQALSKTGLDNPYGFAVWTIRESPGRPPPPAPKPTKGQAPPEPPPQLSDRAREVAQSFRPDAHGRRDYAGMAAALKELEEQQ